ncbi:MAG: polymerase subunit epsilon [Gaiellaceae bacterium]|jgi:DNA polymerase III epsilon subunit family exonuclease|nr:polymerase subunit epsilon [Gaiellaceae bacterium]
MQLSFDAADRLVELVEARHGPVPAEDAAGALYALRHVPVGLARSLLADVVEGDARLCWRGANVGLAAPPGTELSLELATYVVVDLETTGLSPATSSICEIGAVRVRGLELEERFETLVNPRRPLPAAIAALTGIDALELRGAPPVELAVRRFLDFAGDAVLVAHNARFDIGFLDREVERLTGRRIAAPVVDTVWLARRVLAGRLERVGLASLAHFFGTATRPCHRALADAEATAEILLALIGLAQERGARTVAELADLAAPRARRLAGKRSLVAGAPRQPGVYLFRDRNEQVLYVGRARDLRARLTSYFRTERQRPAVEAALGVLARVEWRVLGSELEAALEELRLLRELRPPANARSTRPDRHVYLRRRGAGWCVTETPGPHGPLKSRRRARAAARALEGWDGEPADALPALRAKLKRLSRALRFEDAARLRDRIAALEEAAGSLLELERLRALELCLLVPAVENGFQRAFFVSGGRVAAARTLLPGDAGRVETEAGLAAAARVEASLAPEDTDELLLIGSFLRRPPPELRVVPLAHLRRAA